jgi:putative transposase
VSQVRASDRGCEATILVPKGAKCSLEGAPNGGDVPPILSSRPVWSPILPIEEIGREETVQRRADLGFLKQADAGMAVKEVCRKHGFSEASYYLWRSKFGGMDVSDAKRLKALESENARLKKLLAESMLENEITREVLRKKF